MSNDLNLISNYYFFCMSTASAKLHELLLNTVMLQAMSDVVKSHLGANVSCSRRLLNCCPMCRNPSCADMKQFFARSQKILDSMQKTEKMDHVCQ